MGLLYAVVGKMVPARLRSDRSESGSKHGVVKLNVAKAAFYAVPAKNRNRVVTVEHAKWTVTETL
jgi:hypothetical protein